MAIHIVSKQKGCIHHQPCDTETLRSRYRLPMAVWIAIRSAAPSWRIGREATCISDAIIEGQRQEFVRANGADGLHRD